MILGPPRLQRDAISLSTSSLGSHPFLSPLKPTQRHMRKLILGKLLTEDEKDKVFAYSIQKQNHIFAASK